MRNPRLLVKVDACPLCGGELEAGSVLALRGVAWLPEGELSWWQRLWRRETLRPSGDEFPALRCRACRLFLLREEAEHRGHRCVHD